MPVNRRGDGRGRHIGDNRPQHAGEHGCRHARVTTIGDSGNAAIRESAFEAQHQADADGADHERARSAGARAFETHAGSYQTHASAHQPGKQHDPIHAGHGRRHGQLHPGPGQCVCRPGLLCAGRFYRRCKSLGSHRRRFRYPQGHLRRAHHADCRQQRHGLRSGHCRRPAHLPIRRRPCRDEGSWPRPQECCDQNWHCPSKDSALGRCTAGSH